MTYIRITSAFAAALVIAGACASPGMDIPEGTPSGDLVLQVVGAGSWRVDCTATTIRGRSAARDISGRGGESYDVIALRDLISANCVYEAGTSPLTLTLEEEGMACPFGAFDGGICRTVIGAGESGSFDFAPD